jgi:hypothetical protein
MMSDVYGSSAINIAATGVDDTNQGCFFDRRDGWGCRFTTHSEEGELDIIEFLRPLEVGGLQRRPLSLRGWALQERILPHGLFILRKHKYFGSAMRSGVVKHSRLVTRQKLLTYYPSTSGRLPWSIGMIVSTDTQCVASPLTGTSELHYLDLRTFPPADLPRLCCWAVERQVGASALLVHPVFFHNKATYIPSSNLVLGIN